MELSHDRNNITVISGAPLVIISVSGGQTCFGTTTSVQSNSRTTKLRCHQHPCVSRLRSESLVNGRVGSLLMLLLGKAINTDPASEASRSG